MPSDAMQMLRSKLDSTVLTERPTPVTFAEATHIEDKRTGTLIPFKLWPCQKAALELMEQEERLFLLKARQLGFTWLDLVFWLYCTMYWGNRLVLVCRQNFAEAQDAIHRVSVLHGGLPGDLGPRRIVRQSQTAIWFDNDSRIEALPATQRIARGRAAFGALADEFCFWDWQDTQLVSLNEACQRLHIVTTGNGPGDHASRIWKMGEQGRGRWRTVFFDWRAQPDRLMEPDWYRLNVLEAPEPRLARREYPETAQEAFASPEGAYFERFNDAVNTADVSIVSGWQTFRAVDFGYHSPACLWIQVSPAGQPFVVAEWVPHDLTTDEFAAGILAIEKGWSLGLPPHVTYCDPAGRSVNVQTAESEVEVFLRHGLAPLSRPSSIRDGCVRIISALADPALPLVISDECRWTQEAVGGVKPDKRHVDIYDESSEYTHVLDALRYFFVNWRALSTPYEAPESDHPVMAGMSGRTW